MPPDPSIVMLAVMSVFCVFAAKAFVYVAPPPIVAFRAHSPPFRVMPLPRIPDAVFAEVVVTVTLVPLW